MTDTNLLLLVQKAFSAQQRGSLDEAEKLYESVLAIDPNQFEALHFLGLLNAQRRNFRTAAELVGRSLKVNTQRAEAFSNYARILRELGRNEEAVSNCDRALALNPSLADAHILRGNALRDLRNYGEALASADRALASSPSNVLALMARGDILSRLGRNGDALSSFDRALSLNPNFAEALNGRGIVLTGLGRHDEALASLDRALAINANYADAHCNRGNVFAGLGRLGDALQCYERALALDSNHVGALNNRGSILLDLGRSTEAVAQYRRTIEIWPDLSAQSSLICALNFDPGASAHLQAAERKRWQELFTGQFGAQIEAHQNDRDPDRRLRIGYVSNRFRDDAASYAFGGVIIAHDPERFDVTCYSDTRQEDGVTGLLRAGARQWCDTANLADDALAAQIRADRIDILVDCSGHTAGHRLAVFARKPAPIQVTAWGEPTGSGLKAMDYLLADTILIPTEQRALLTEEVFDLPNFLGTWLPDAPPDVPALPAATNGFVTFGSFNRFATIQDPVLRCWAAILRASPQSRLVIKAHQAPGDESQRNRIDAVLANEGIAAERVVLAGGSERAGHFAAYRDIDIALDPFPHGGSMTTLDALWMGVPVVTRLGPTIPSRLAAASLTAVGLTDFIAQDDLSYIRIAVAKGSDLDALASLRARLRAMVADSVVGETNRYTRAVEAAYRTMWRRWCAATA